MSPVEDFECVVNVEGRAACDKIVSAVLFPTDGSEDPWPVCKDHIDINLYGYGRRVGTIEELIIFEVMNS